MRSLLTIGMALFTAISFSQNAVNWSTSLTAHRSFIENKGQFDSFQATPDSPIMYALDDGHVMVLFSDSPANYQ